MIDFVKNITLTHAMIAAVILALVAIVVVRRGILASLLWIGAIILVVIGVVNYLSYQAGGG